MARHAARRASMGIAQGTATEARRPEIQCLFLGGSCRPSSMKLQQRPATGGETQPPDAYSFQGCSAAAAVAVWHDEGRHALCTCRHKCWPCRVRLLGNSTPSRAAHNSSAQPTGPTTRPDSSR
eukprot:scaffold34620_cov69-Phaeocystis_antarctica.AAC.6